MSQLQIGDRVQTGIYDIRVLLHNLLLKILCKLLLKIDSLLLAIAVLFYNILFQCFGRNSCLPEMDFTEVFVLTSSFILTLHIEFKSLIFTLLQCFLTSSLIWWQHYIQQSESIFDETTFCNNQVQISDNFMEQHYQSVREPPDLCKKRL